MAHQLGVESLKKLFRFTSSSNLLLQLFLSSNLIHLLSIGFPYDLLQNLQGSPYHLILSTHHLP